MANLPAVDRSEVTAVSPEFNREPASRTNALEIEETGFTYPYPFTRFNVLQMLYRQGRPNKQYPYIAVGKLFFTIGASNYVCSASVIRPHLLLTARHCIFDYPTGTWATNVVFYPGYYAGSNADLGGAWVARVLYTWVSNAAASQYDIGFVQLFNSARTACGTGTTIENVTGYLGYSYGGSYEKKQFNAFGYPAGAPFNGNVLVESQSATGALNVLGEGNTVEAGNDMTGGSSGGPWLTNFRPGVVGAFNYANGVNSYKWISPNHSQAMNSPQFQAANFYNLLVGAMGLACP
jgi:V8-like Glu-specific endopeptidase